MRTLLRSWTLFFETMMAFLSLLIRTGTCVHPHPNTTRQVKDYYRSMRQTYPMSFINSGLCSRTSFQRCVDLEKSMLDNARKLEGVYVTQGFVRVLVLLIQFKDHRDRELPPVEHYEELFNGEEQSDIIPTGSIAQWLEDNSYGALKIEAEVMDWVVTDMTEEEYSFGVSGVDIDFRKAMYPALDELENQGFDFGRFDMNNDGMIDSVMVLHSGYAAEIGGVDCYSGAEVENRIWSHAISSHDDNWQSESSGIRVFGYGVSSGLRGLCNARVARISVITHEFMHTLGLPDLNDRSGDGVGRGLGDFDIMSNAHGSDGSQLLPSFLSPWSRVKLGWTEPVEITAEGTYEIEDSEESNDLFIIRQNFPSGEYLLIENRQPLMWDQLLWGGGLLIWHLDDEQELVQYRGYPGQDGWPGNGQHYGIALVPADGHYDLEKGNNSGDDGDYWRDGALIGPGPVEDDATYGGVYPNTNSYQKGKIQQTGITIDQISESSALMSFRVRFSSQDSVYPASLNPEATSEPTTSPVTDSEPISQPSPSPLAEPTSEPTFSEIPSLLPFLNPSQGPLNIEPISLGNFEATSEPSKSLAVEPFSSQVPALAPVSNPSQEPLNFEPIKFALDQILMPSESPSLLSSNPSLAMLPWIPISFPSGVPTIESVFVSNPASSHSQSPVYIQENNSSAPSMVPIREVDLPQPSLGTQLLGPNSSDGGKMFKAESGAALFAPLGCPSTLLILSVWFLIR